MAGNAIVGQSGGPTSVINSSLAGLVQTALASTAIGQVLGMRYGIEGLLQEEILDFGNEDPITMERLRHTPSSALGSCRYKLQDRDLPRVLEILRKYGIRHFFLIGGNDSMDTIQRVENYCRAHGYALNGVGVPKTVDNDLSGTDHTPGYPSAARFTALSLRQAGRLARDMQRVDAFVVHQTVGREAGWLAASSALARSRPGDAPHLIYVPERPITREGVIRDVEACLTRHGWCSIVCGEGIRWSDGSPVSASGVRDGFANLEFGASGGTSAAIHLHGLIQAATGRRGEFQITESLPMCAIDRASPLDLEEAYRCGAHAVELVLSDVSGVMVALERKPGVPCHSVCTAVPLEEVALKARPMPDSFIAPGGNDVTQAFLDYLAPLVGPLEEYAELANTASDFVRLP
jgi:ATP-dependent phosphofructokinase / diphosphate-dependent phosphofructokinase